MWGSESSLQPPFKGLGPALLGVAPGGRNTAVIRKPNSLFRDKLD
jgi:hypothetical protein